MAEKTTVELPRDRNGNVFEFGHDVLTPQGRITSGMWSLDYDEEEWAVVCRGAQDECYCPPCACELLSKDSPALLTNDRHKLVYEYWRCHGYACDDCHILMGRTPANVYNVTDCQVAMGVDIARRERALEIQ